MALPAVKLFRKNSRQGTSGWSKEASLGDIDLGRGTIGCDSTRSGTSTLAYPQLTSTCCDTQLA